MMYDIKNSCGNKRGCSVVIVLPYDSRPGLILSKVYATGYDFSPLQPVANSYLDKEQAKEESLEKMAA